ncbi:MAG TPA: urate hydroxylase PuuD [Pyrinomonadaceae bacterium]|jgi:uncharacterized membrane protein
MTLDPDVSEWLNLLTRWFHVFAGILWIGTTYFFTGLDARFTEAEAGDKASGAEVWMVHSGGFYVIEKRQTHEPSRQLHWFRWEAALTWLSGFLLLVLVYYMGGALIDRDVRDISLTMGIIISVSLLVVAWLVYDLMMLSPLGRNGRAFALIAYLLIVATTYGLTRVFSGRAAYIQVGAIFGTIMAANVWMRILPAQRRMIAAIKEGRKPDAALAERAKLRSKQNTYMVVPLVFTMISNHFPVATYGSRYNWTILAGLILLGWLAAHFIRKA